MTHAELKDKQRRLRENFHSNLTLRTHRALSWLDKAEQSEGDLDGQFIFLWIAFNAAYATDVDEQYRTTEKGIFEAFFTKLLGLDSNNRLYDLVWSEFPGPIRSLMDNPFIFQPYWDFQNGKIDEGGWRTAFQQSKAKAYMGLANTDTTLVLSVIFRRIYTLRNQVIHGGATWNSSANRQQLKDCIAIMNKIVPTIIDLMMDNPDQLWGDAFYPYLEEG